MGRLFSPLRYPGGKTSMLALMAAIIRENDLQRTPYVEPFAGGCGLALGLLFHGYVSEIHVNDIDPAVWAFWHCVLTRPEELIQRVDSADLSVPEWRRQREVCLKGDLNDPLALGFSTFFLNRTNRSGIIKGAGLIGGLAQTGNYKLDCRFNRDELAHRIRRIYKYRDRITLTRLDALDFLASADSMVARRAMFCIDPPYFKKGSSLYTSFYRAADHAALAKVILDLDRQWVVTYDNCPEINDLYASRSRYTFDVNYSVQTKRSANELLISSAGLDLPFALEGRRVA